MRKARGTESGRTDDHDHDYDYDHDHVCEEGDEGGDPIPKSAVERLDCYRVAVEFQVMAASLVPRALPVLRDQLERGSTSIVLNLAEGVGRRTGGEQARFFVIAKGSAMECLAIVDIVQARKIAPDEACRKAKEKVVRVVQMLSRLERTASTKGTTR